MADNKNVRKKRTAPKHTLRNKLLAVAGGLLAVFLIFSFTSTDLLKGQITYDPVDLEDPFSEELGAARVAFLEAATTVVDEAAKLSVMANELQKDFDTYMKTNTDDEWTQLGTAKAAHASIVIGKQAVELAGILLDNQILATENLVDFFNNEHDRVATLEDLPEEYYEDWSTRVDAAEEYLTLLEELKSDLEKDVTIVITSWGSIRNKVRDFAALSRFIREETNTVGEMTYVTQYFRRTVFGRVFLDTDWSQEQIDFGNFTDFELWEVKVEAGQDPNNQVFNEAYFEANKDNQNVYGRIPNLNSFAFKYNTGFFDLAVVRETYFDTAPLNDRYLIVIAHPPGYKSEYLGPVKFKDPETLKIDGIDPVEKDMKPAYRVNVFESGQNTNGIEHATVGLKLSTRGTSFENTLNTYTYVCEPDKDGAYYCPVSTFAASKPQNIVLDTTLMVLAQDYEFYQRELSSTELRKEDQDDQIVIDVALNKIDIEPDPIPDVVVPEATCIDIDLSLSQYRMTEEDEPERITVTVDLEASGNDFVGGPLIIERNGDEWQTEDIDFEKDGGTGDTRSYEFDVDAYIGDEFTAYVDGSVNCGETSKDIDEEKVDEPDFFDNFDCEEPFYDVNENQWFGNHICFLYNWREVIRGRTRTLAAPQSAMTRAEFIAVLLRLFELDDRYTGREYFSDNPEHLWHNNYVNVAYEEGIISLNGGKARPNEPIRRGEAAVMLYNLYDELDLIDDDIDTDIRDLDGVCEDVSRHHYSSEAFAYLAQLEGEVTVNGARYVVTGDGRTGDCRPDDYMDRASLAVIALRGLLAVSDPYELIEENPDLFDLVVED